MTTINTTTVWGANTGGGSGIVIPSAFGANYAAWFASLPTVDPLINGAFWNNGNTLSESTGIPV